MSFCPPEYVHTKGIYAFEIASGSKPRHTGKMARRSQHFLLFSKFTNCQTISPAFFQLSMHYPEPASIL